MALVHVGSAEVVALWPVNEAHTSEKTMALVKTGYFEIIRVVMPAGKEIAEHDLEGPVIVQCLEGRVVVTANGKSLELAANGLVHLDPRTPYALSAIEESAVLLTIIFV